MHSDFRRKAILSFTLVSVLAAYGMQAYLGLFVEGSFASIIDGLGMFSAIVVVLCAAGILAFARLLSPLHAAMKKLDEGKSLGSEEQEAARAVSARLFTVVIVVQVVAFIVGPIVSTSIQAAMGKSYAPGEILTMLFINVSIGFMAGVQIVSLVDNSLYLPLARLGVYSIGEGKKPVSIKGRVILAGIATAFLAGTLVGTAGTGEAFRDAPLTVTARTGLFLACIAWSALVFSNVASTIARRIGIVAATLEEMGSSSGGAAARIPVVREDEIGRLASAFNSFLDGFDLLLKRVRETSDRVYAGAESLNSTSEHASQAVTGLEQSLTSMRAAVDRQTETVSSTEGEIARLLQSIETVAARVADQASSVEQSSAAVSEMAANIASVSRTAARADELAKKLKEASEEGGKALKDSVGAIGEIEAASRSVKEIIGTISKIASQTNLLAMNAAIEAAHAGVAGAGFAVVADEVRGLAESSSKSAKEIVSLIQGMIQKIERGAALSDRAGAAFDRIREGVAETGELVQTIAASMSEQRQGAEEILSSVGALTEATQKIKELTEEQKAESKEMGEAMLRIVGASNEIFEALQEETGSTQSLGRVVQSVSDEAKKNRELVKSLEENITQFKVEA